MAPVLERRPGFIDRTLVVWVIRTGEAQSILLSIVSFSVEHTKKRRPNGGHAMVAAKGGEVILRPACHLVLTNMIVQVLYKIHFLLNFFSESDAFQVGCHAGIIGVAHDTAGVYRTKGTHRETGIVESFGGSAFDICHGVDIEVGDGAFVES
jgi:hypothetical protein